MILDLLAKRHDEWVAMAKTLNAPAPEDLVQDMYLRIHRYVKDPERIMYGEQVNTFFVFVTLRNLNNTQIKNNKYTPLEFDLQAPQDDMQLEEAFNDLFEKLWTEVASWHWYDRKLFEYYHNNPKATIQKIADQSNISARSIWNTLNNGKQKIKEVCKDEYEAYAKVKGTRRHSRKGNEGNRD